MDIVVISIEIILSSKDEVVIFFNVILIPDGLILGSFKHILIPFGLIGVAWEGDVVLSYKVIGFGKGGEKKQGEWEFIEHV